VDFPQSTHALEDHMSRRPFSTTVAFPDEPDWKPLEAVARIARDSADLPSFHEAEFMYMASANDSPTGRIIHLYKHRDTRCYLSLDDAGHAYEYCGSSPGVSSASSAGRYRLHTSLADALEGADLWLFEREPAFLRSFPPEDWPSAGASNKG
jgi:hypothetical protein